MRSFPFRLTFVFTTLFQLLLEFYVALLKTESLYFGEKIMYI